MSSAARRRIVVAGAGSAIGRACARELVATGCDVALLDESRERLEASVATLAQESVRATFISRDVPGWDLDHLEEAAGACADTADGSIDGLIVYFAALDPSPPSAADAQAWRRSFESHVVRPVELTRAFLPYLRRSAAPAVVYFGSIDGLAGNPSLAAYSVSKGALIPLSHVLAAELGSEGIRVNCVAIAGADLPPDEVGFPVPPEATERLVAATPLRRLGDPAEFARVAIFLASPAASYVTGSVVVVDGGRSATTPGTSWHGIAAICPGDGAPSA